MIRYKKNPVKKSVMVQVDGIEYQGKYIGRGGYSKVYRVGDRVVYYTRGDCSKEVLSMFQYERMTHLPEIIRHENITTERGTWYIFSSPYYRNVTMKDKSAYSLMKEIIRVAGEAIVAGWFKGHRGIDLMLLVVNVMKRHQAIPRSVVKALQEIVDVSSNCGDHIGFDLCRQNFGVNDYGTLIFRDPVYVKE